MALVANVAEVSRLSPKISWNSRRSGQDSTARAPGSLSDGLPTAFPIYGLVNQSCPCIVPNSICLQNGTPRFHVLGTALRSSPHGLQGDLRSMKPRRSSLTGRRLSPGHMRRRCLKSPTRAGARLTRGCYGPSAKNIEAT